MDNYKKALQKDTKLSEDYYKKSINKTEQQKFLENILKKTDIPSTPLKISDIACGGGTLSYHLSVLFKDASFYLRDYNEEAIALARDITDNQFDYGVDNIYDMKFDDDCFDLTFCWQTLSWIEEPEKALNELIRITKPGGKIFLSSLFNTKFDVDLYTKVLDHTRQGSSEGLYVNYNTYSKLTIEGWLAKRVKGFEIIDFDMDIDLTYDERGLGSYTIQSAAKNLQLSAGMLLNWGILVIEK